MLKLYGHRLDACRSRPLLEFAYHMGTEKQVPALHRTSNHSKDHFCPCISTASPNLESRPLHFLPLLHHLFHRGHPQLGTLPLDSHEPSHHMLLPPRLKCPLPFFAQLLFQNIVRRFTIAAWTISTIRCCLTGDWGTHRARRSFS